MAILPKKIGFNQRHLKITSDDVSEITENFVKSVPIIERSVNRMMDKRSYLLIYPATSEGVFDCSFSICF